MKVYVHFSETGQDPFTVVAQVTNVSLSVKLVQQAIVEYLLDKQIKVPEKSEVSLHKGTKALNPSESVGKLLQDKQDLTGKFVASAAIRKKDAGKLLNPDEKRRQQIMQTLYNHGNMEAKQMPDGKTKFTPKTVADWLMLGNKWKILGEPRKTLDILFGLLQRTKGIPEVYEEIVKIYLEANRPVVARSYVETSLQVYPDYTRIKLRDAECLMALDQPEQAIDVLMDYTRDLRQGEKASVEEKHEVQLALCRAYQLKGHKDMALAVIVGVVRELQELHLENIPVMIEYARLTFDLSQKHAAEATNIIVIALVGDKDNKFRQKALAEICQKTGGVENLLLSLKHAASDPEGLAFMANTIRKRGAVKEALFLLEKAISYKSQLANVILNYMHVQELVQGYQKAFDAAVEFFQQNPKMKAGSVTNEDVLSCLEPCIGKDIFMFSNQDSDSNDSLVSALDRLTVTPNKPCDNSSVISTDSRCKITSEKLLPIEYSDDDLYLLAAWFTLVKILYISGTLPVIPALVKVLNPVHRGKNLHTTIIRNEAAYYGAISQIAYTWVDPSLTPIIPSTSSQPDILYFLADSHCLTSAWKTIQFRNRPHLIRPLLSTGTKVWHLRPGEVFYPKANFKSCVKQIPHRAAVIVLFGEIDCREALTVCYNKCRYESIEEAIDVLLNIYIKTLQDLRQEHNWTIFVHPVPPVLEVSREHVSKFNSMLEKRLLGERHLHWLDMVEGLYDTETKAFKYEFDQTHLHPSYLPLLESALNKISIPEDHAWTVD